MQIRVCQVRKRDGRVVSFDASKIADAIYRAAEAVGGSDRELAAELAGAVTEAGHPQLDAPLSWPTRSDSILCG